MRCHENHQFIELLCNAPSKFVQELKSCHVQWSKRFHGYGHKDSLCQLSIFQWLPVCRGRCCSTRRDDRYDWAKVSVTVTSQVTHLPFFHGISVRPSGLFPSNLNRPVGSLTEGTLAFPSARQTKSFKLWWQADRPVPPLHESPWSPLASVTTPHGHWCGLQMLAPSRRPTAMCIVLSSKRSPHAESGNAFNQSQHFYYYYYYYYYYYCYYRILTLRFENEFREFASGYAMIKRQAGAPAGLQLIGDVDGAELAIYGVQETVAAAHRTTPIYWCHDHLVLGRTQPRPPVDNETVGDQLRSNRRRTMFNIQRT